MRSYDPSDTYSRLLQCRPSSFGIQSRSTQRSWPYTHILSIMITETPSMKSFISRSKSSCECHFPFNPILYCICVLPDKDILPPFVREPYCVHIKCHRVEYYITFGSFSSSRIFYILWCFNPYLFYIWSFRRTMYKLIRSLFTRDLARKF